MIGVWKKAFFAASLIASCVATTTIALADDKIVATFDVDFDGEATARDIQLVVNDFIGLGPTGFPTDVNFDFFVDATDVYTVVNDRLGFFICPGGKRAPFWPSFEKQIPIYTIIGTDFELGAGENAYVFNLGVNPAAPGARFSTLAYTVLYDNNVVEPVVDFFNAPRLAVLTGDDIGFFYQKDFNASICFPGRIEVVVGGFNANSVTSFDNQIFDFGHDASRSTNPLPLGVIQFLGIGPPGSISAIAVSEITAASSTGNLLPASSFATEVSTIKVAGTLQQSVPTIVSGFVTDAATGAPVPGAVVEFSSTTQTLVGTAETDLGGFYFFDAVPAGTYSIRITSVGYGETTHGTITVSGGADIRNFELARTQEPIDVGGQVVDVDFGFPLVRVFVEAIINSQVVATTYTDGNGNFEFRGLPIVTTTTVTLRFTLDGYNPLTVNVVLHPDTPSQQAPKLKIGGPAAASISGFVFAKQPNGSNSPLAAARVALRGGVQASTTSDSKGGFSFDAVPEGDYVIHVSKPGFASQSISRNVKSTEAEFQNFALDVGESSGSGDIDGNGQVNSIDIQLVINTVLNISFSAADINGDGSVNAQDIQLVINIVLGLKGHIWDLE